MAEMEISKSIEKERITPSVINQKFILKKGKRKKRNQI
jgi:hypothetical protein